MHILPAPQNPLALANNFYFGVDEKFGGGEAHSRYGIAVDANGDPFSATRGEARSQCLTTRRDK